MPRTALQREISHQSFPFPVHFVALVQELEALLLADPRAIETVTEANGVEHAAEVDAKSLYEAVCRGWCFFMAGSWELFDPSWAAREFTVELIRGAKSFKVDINKMLDYRCAEGLSVRERERRKKLKNLMYQFGE